MKMTAKMDTATLFSRDFSIGCCPRYGGFQEVAETIAENNDVVRIFSRRFCCFLFLGKGSKEYKEVKKNLGVWKLDEVQDFCSEKILGLVTKRELPVLLKLERDAIRKQRSGNNTSLYV